MAVHRCYSYFFLLTTRLTLLTSQIVDFATYTIGMTIKAISSNTLFCKPVYAAPEILSGAAPAKSSDVYAFGK